MDEEFGPETPSERAARHERGDMRDSLFLQAATRFTPDGPQMLLRVRNLSAGGMMADCTVAAERGQQVEVELRNIGVIAGKVMWQRGQRIGVAFEQRIDPRLARTPVGTHATETMLVKRSAGKSRRPGLFTE